MSSAEWAAALCCEPPDALPSGACKFDFEDGEDGSLTERFGHLLTKPENGARAGSAPHLSHPPHVRFAHWLHECIIESKLVTYPLFLLIFMQTRHVLEDCTDRPVPFARPASLVSSALAMDQLITVEQFYCEVREGIGARHRPLLSSDFLASRLAAVRGAFEEGGSLGSRVVRALQAQYGSVGYTSDAASDLAVAALYSRLHGLPGNTLRLGNILDASRGKNALAILPQLRRAFPDASVQVLRKLVAAIDCNR